MTELKIQIEAGFATEQDLKKSLQQIEGRSNEGMLPRQKKRWGYNFSRIAIKVLKLLLTFNWPCSKACRSWLKTLAPLTLSVIHKNQYLRWRQLLVLYSVRIVSFLRELAIGHNWLVGTAYKRHKVSYGVPLAWQICLFLVTWRHLVTYTYVILLYWETPI